ncbi:MAG: protein kinase [Planctomycetaceae bacterium]|nr:protein kinase [Planctomycetaceae bacterium]
MIPQSVDALERLIVPTGLVYPEEFAACRTAAGEGCGPAEVLAVLERRQLLTPFQSQRIRKGEVAGLVLGGVKLLYRNASGSFARLYRGSRIEDGRMLGIKVLRERWASDPGTVALFHREGEIGQRLKHRNIVPIYGTGTDGKFHYITMEFVEGGNLRDFMKIRGKLDAVETCRFGLDMARGLEYAIQQGITHRDLKTTNVLISSQGIAKLIDFGLAADDSMLRRTDGPDLAVALEYSTLERNTDAPANDPRSDLFFLGTILYELMSGQSPYPRTRDREERKRFSRYRDIRPLSSYLPNLNFRVGQIVDRLLQVNPNLRYQAASEVVAELEAVLRDLGHPDDSKPAKAASPADGMPTVLCVEHRPKLQDLLRDYLTRHGYRVLLLSDPDRALTRVANNPPDAVMFFQEASGDRVINDFKKTLATGKTAAVVVVGKQQASMVDELNGVNSKGAALAQPVQLRDLRNALKDLVGEGKPTG